MTALPDIAETSVELLPATSTASDRSPYHVYLDSLTSDESKRTMRGCLNRIARLTAGVDAEQWEQLPPTAREDFGATLHWEQLTYAHTSHIRTLLIEQGWAPAYINKHLVALRRVLKEAWRLGQMSAEQRDRASDLPPVKGTRLPAGTHVPPESLAAVLGVCDAAATSELETHRIAGARDGAILAALYSTGCRRAELTGLALADYDPGTRSLRVRGKGGKERLVYLIPDAMARLEQWIALRGRTPGALFPPLRKGGHLRIDGRGRPVHMTPRALGTILDARYAQALVARRTPHDFRRTFVGELLDAGVDLATTQALVGHASPATTARYDRRPERRRQEATDKLTLPKARPPRSSHPNNVPRTDG
ncbi:tyrosine-type recombinase/integrase [Microbispora bryophytorum]|uniref:tyrosine-type recombinase/integrase n=1 Tax=Microbispora bryophytorum TaxID=1460882 RepID=UPI003401FD4A